jgi:outer membrane murein-binding lipoprotein Lpp
MPSRECSQATIKRDAATQQGPGRMKSMIAIAVIVTLMVAGCQGSSRPARTTSQVQAAQPAVRQLSAAELRQIYAAGVTSYSSGSSGPKTFAGYYSPDGKIILHSPQMNDIGTYRITDDGEFCTRYTTIRNGVETCQTMWQVDQNTIEGHLPNGAVIQATSVPGNPEGF